MEAHEASSVSSDSDAPFGISESLVPARELKAAGITSVSFDGLLQEPLLLKEDLKDGCGGQLWPAGMVLAKYMLREHRTDLLGKTMSVCPYLSPRTLWTDSCTELSLVRAVASLGLRSLAVVLSMHRSSLRTRSPCCL